MFCECCSVAEPALRWNSPMKDPALQMRLKTQLSGGSVPHLLQSERWRTSSGPEEAELVQVQASLKPSGDLRWPHIQLSSWPRLTAQCETFSQNSILTQNKNNNMSYCDTGDQMRPEVTEAREAFYRVLFGKIERRAGISCGHILQPWTSQWKWNFFFYYIVNM